MKPLFSCSSCSSCHGDAHSRSEGILLPVPALELQKTSMSRLNEPVFDLKFTRSLARMRRWVQHGGQWTHGQHSRRTQGFARVFGRLQLECVSADLSGDACMISAWQPEGRSSMHALKPGHDVFQCDKHGMAHVQGAGDIWRWPACINMQLTC